MKCDINCGVQANDVAVIIDNVFITRQTVNKPIVKKEAEDDKPAEMEDNYVVVFDLRYRLEIKKSDKTLNIPELKFTHCEWDNKTNPFDFAMEHFKAKEEVTLL